MIAYNNNNNNDNNNKQINNFNSIKAITREALVPEVTQIPIYSVKIPVPPSIINPTIPHPRLTLNAAFQ